jgi:hypothetical protein
MFILFPGREPKSKDQELFRKAEYITHAKEADVMQRTQSRRLPACARFGVNPNHKNFVEASLSSRDRMLLGNAGALDRTEDARIFSKVFLTTVCGRGRPRSQ